MKKITLEVIAESVESAICAENGGADRLEVCVNLAQGGVTPGLGLVQKIKKEVNIPVFVMIRPRPGDFLYSRHEFEVMLQDMELFMPWADGFVFGLLKPDGQIDVERTRELVKQAQGKDVTFHRAYDLSSHPEKCFEQVLETGATRLLTAGWNTDVDKGYDTLMRLNELNNGRIIILPGGGITHDNAGRVIKEGKFFECHFSAKTVLKSNMQYIHPSFSQDPEYSTGPTGIFQVDQRKVEELVKILNPESMPFT